MTTVWEVTFDGWFSAILGACVSIGVAVFVLRRTLEADREQFLQQLEAERAFALEQRRLEAFGEVAGQFRRLETQPSQAEAREIFSGVTMAVARWRMYLRESAPIGHVLEALSLGLISAALVRAADETPAQERAIWSSRISTTLREAVEAGLAWHTGDIDDRALKERWRNLNDSLVAQLPAKLPGTK